MTTPTIPTAGDLGFSYELQIDIDLNYQGGGAADWNQLAFITKVEPGNDKNFADAATYKNRGAAAQAITGESWQLAFDHQLQRTTGGLYIPTLATLVEASKFGKRNKLAKAHLRWYDTEGADWAFEGTGYVAMGRANTGNNDIAAMSFTITGDGEATEITNPYAVPLPTTPAIVSVLPSGQGTGDLVTIKGQRFTAATGVSFGVTAATQFAVSDDSTIVAEVPSGSAGSVNVKVTNATGDSNLVAYTRAA